MGNNPNGFIVVRSIENTLTLFSGEKFSYSYLTEEDSWTWEEKKARTFSKRNSAQVYVNKLGLGKNKNIVVIEK